jgi:hypothetical protein
MGRFVRVYLGLGVMWCLMTNLIAMGSGAVTPVVAAAGPHHGVAKLVAIVVEVFRVVLLWPLEVYERVIRPLFM